jgi:hypothetical protein
MYVVRDVFYKCVKFQFEKPCTLVYTKVTSSEGSKMYTVHYT